MIPRPYRSPVSGKKVLYIVRTYSERSGAVISRALAGKNAFSEQMFTDDRFAEDGARMYTEAQIWCLELTKHAMTEETNVVAVYNEFRTSSSVYPYASLARDLGWLPYIVDCKTVTHDEKDKLAADEYRNRWEDIWIQEMN